jgi:glutathione S-transferase
MIVERTLHHFPLDPYSREARLVLGEKRLPFREVVERYWERPESLAALNPSGLTPVLVETRGAAQVVVCESRPILEHLEEQYPEPALLPADAGGRAEARRLMQWFDRKFDYEVNGLLLHEKMEKRLLGLGSPDPHALRHGRETLRAHLAYLEELLNARDWLAGDRLSLPDFCAAAHLSVIDYMGEAPWSAFPATKTWYAKIKSRPCFRPLLTDRQPGLPPSAHYHDLDF